MSSGAFTFVDLFAGIGGFHAALSAAGGRCVHAVEIDPLAAAVYERNWGLDPLGDVRDHVTSTAVSIPAHDVLAAGFPCQPFSKSGAQRGMEEARGTLFWDIARIVEARRPTLVVLENVRNLAGPRHAHEWQIIVSTLRELSYRVSETPAVFSPHLLPPSMGGRPQVRDRVFITATLDPDGLDTEFSVEPPVRSQPVPGWDPQLWDLAVDLPLDEGHATGCELSPHEEAWIDAWDEFVRMMWEEREGRRLPGFPLWVDGWVPSRQLRIPAGSPRWKADFLRKNAAFYDAHSGSIDGWVRRRGIDRFPPSRRKLEWQAQDASSLWDCVIHMRPSGIRAKRPTYLPALVAITQTSIIGPRRRRLSPREAARLQGLPDWFDFGGQRDTATYRQLGNGVSVGAVWHVLRSHAARDRDLLERSCPGLLEGLFLHSSPDEALAIQPLQA